MSKRWRRNFMRDMRRKRANKSKALMVRPGDVVFVATRGLAGPDKTLCVTEVRERFGATNGGRNPTAPLVIGHDVATGEGEAFDIGWVASIVSRATVKPVPTNYFRQLREAGKLIPVTGKRRGEWVGTLDGLAMWALSCLPFTVFRELDYGRLEELYHRNAMPGFRGYGQSRHFLRVNSKVFAKWVRRNTGNICRTVAELHSDATDRNHEWELDMEIDMRQLFDEDNREDVHLPVNGSDWEPW